MLDSSHELPVAILMIRVHVLGLLERAEGLGELAYHAESLRHVHVGVVQRGRSNRSHTSLAVLGHVEERATMIDALDVVVRREVQVAQVLVRVADQRLILSVDQR